MKHIFTSFVIFPILALPATAQTSAPHRPADPIAFINGQPIHQEDLTPDLISKLLQLHNQEYQIEINALDELIQKRLIEDAAQKRGVSVEELLKDEVDSKIAEPTDAEILGYYLAVRNEINKPLDEIKPMLQKAVRLLAIAEARKDYAKSLRSKNDVRVLLSPPKVEVAYDPARVRGNPSAPVTIVEFADFQCPYCKRAHATLEDLLARYKGQVKLAYRDFPMRTLHPQAQIAAEAGRCAEEQGKFWEYYDALFTDQVNVNLDEMGLAATARKLGLNEEVFHSCLTSGKFRTEIDQDVQAGARAGVAGTPAFFINGEFVNGAQPEAELVKIIDRELAAAGENSRTEASCGADGPFKSCSAR